MKKTQAGRSDLFLGDSVCATKDTDYYKEAKRLQREGT
jgi:hypothetical protein